jgi:hypothetical protein
VFEEISGVVNFDYNRTLKTAFSGFYVLTAMNIRYDILGCSVVEIGISPQMFRINLSIAVTRFLALLSL